MESEKVKEIKKGLEEYIRQYSNFKGAELCKEALTLINELESENERLKWEKQTLEDKDTLLAKVGEMVQENQQLIAENTRLKHLNNSISIGADLHAESYKQEITELEKENTELKDRIAELEKGNEALSFAVKQGFNDCQTKTLKQFAERLKEKAVSFEGERTAIVSFKSIDETLKEFIND